MISIKFIIIIKLSFLKSINIKWYKITSENLLTVI